MRPLFAVLLFMSLGACAAARARAGCGAQVLNPMFVAARNGYGELAPAQKAQLADEWHELETEQKSLWKEAGQVDGACDRGQVYEDVSGYNERISAWEFKLKRFIKHLEEAPRPDVTGRPPEPAPVPEAQGEGYAAPPPSKPTQTPPAPAPSTKAKPRPKAPVQETLPALP